MSDTKNKTVANLKKQVGDSLENAAEYLEDKYHENYDKALDRMKYEKERLENELRHGYRSTRRYVRANPEKSLGITFLSGLALGILLVSVLKD